MVLTSKRLSLPPRARKHYPGSTNGDLISGIAWGKIADEWHVSWKEKREMYGKKHLIAVGGKTEHTGDEPKINNRSNNEKEPFCYNSAPESFLEEILHGYFVKSVVDMSPADGKLAFVCLRQRVGYVGICYNEQHVKALEKRLLQRLEKEMVNSNSPLFSSAYAAAIGGVESNEATPPPPKPKPKNKATAKNKAKAKPKTQPAAKNKNGKRPRDQEEAEEQDVEGDEEDVGEHGGGDEEEDEGLWDPLAE